MLKYINKKNLILQICNKKDLIHEIVIFVCTFYLLNLFLFFSVEVMFQSISDCQALNPDPSEKSDDGITSNYTSVGQNEIFNIYY